MKFVSGEFPEELKISKVVLVLKGGGKTDINNYSSISVPPFFSNIFQHIMNDELIRFLFTSIKNNAGSKCFSKE